MAGKAKKTGIPVRVAIPENIRGGVHANLVSVTTTSDGEVILDFVFSHPQDKKGSMQQGTLVSRVVLSTAVAKKLLPILMAHLGKEKKE